MTKTFAMATSTTSPYQRGQVLRAGASRDEDLPDDLPILVPAEPPTEQTEHLQ
jgi:hypothetical protein